MFVECAMAVVQVGDTGEKVLWSWTIGPERGSLANFQILSHASAGGGLLYGIWKAWLLKNTTFSSFLRISSGEYLDIGGYLIVFGYSLM